MNRTHVLVAVVALLSVGALAVAAATVDAPRSGDPGYGTGTGSGVGDDAGDAQPAPEPSNPGLGIPPILAVVGMIVMAIVTVVGILYLLVSLRLSDVVRVAIAGVAVMLVSVLIFSLIGPALPDGAAPSQAQQATNESGGGSGDLGDRRPQQETPDDQFDLPIVLVGLLGLFALALSLTIVRFSGSEQAAAVAAAASGGDDDADGDVAAVGEAAGRAADELDDAGLENAVYRAWEEMTDALEVPRAATTTPTEFADAAVEAGMSRGDVRELTDLFEEVRYGDRPVTDERERRAEAALRRIESAYAGVDDE